MPQLSPTPSTTPSHPRRLLALSLLTAALALPACAGSHFDSEWKQATTPITTDPATSIAGKWEGTWQSNGFDYYNGMARAIVTPDDVSTEYAGAPGKHYRVDMKLFYFDLLPRDFSFIVTTAPGHDDKTAVTGEKDFGARSDGVWKFEGDAEGRALYMSYVSVKDYGTITLRRFPPPNP